jgi:hypothetical protein
MAQQSAIDAMDSFPAECFCFRIIQDSPRLYAGSPFPLSPKLLSIRGAREFFV